MVSRVVPPTTTAIATTTANGPPTLTAAAAHLRRRCQPPTSKVVRLRLARFGRKHAPTYRIVAADARCPRDGKHIEQVGSYDPTPRKDGTKEIRLKADRIKCVRPPEGSTDADADLRDAGMRPPPLPLRPSPSRARHHHHPPARFDNELHLSNPTPSTAHAS